MTNIKKSEYMHVKIRLKSIAQVTWEHGRNIHKMLLNKDYMTYTICLKSILNYQLLKPKTMISPMQFARAPRPIFYYSEDHFTEKWIMHLIQNPKVDNY